MRLNVLCDLVSRFVSPSSVSFAQAQKPPRPLEHKPRESKSQQTYRQGSWGRWQGNAGFLYVSLVASPASFMQ